MFAAVGFGHLGPKPLGQFLSAKETLMFNVRFGLKQV